MRGNVRNRMSAIYRCHRNAWMDAIWHPECYTVFQHTHISALEVILPSCAVSWAKGPKRSPYGSWAHLSYGVRSTPGDATSAETGLVLMRWRGAGDVAASQGLADGQAIAAKHRQGDAARHLASERCMGRVGGTDENKNCRLCG